MSTKRAVKAVVAKRFVNPLTRSAARWTSLVGVLETTGRKSGLPRRTPVGGRMRGGAYVFVAEDGLHADYVKNIQADPHVRVRVKDTWYEGRAVLLPNEDPKRFARSLFPFEWTLLRVFGIDPLPIRVELQERRQG